MDLTLEHEREVMAQRMFAYGLEPDVIRHRSSVERTFVDWARLSGANFRDVDSERAPRRSWSAFRAARNLGCGFGCIAQRYGGAGDF
jgi:hypothetical protein